MLQHIAVMEYDVLEHKLLDYLAEETRLIPALVGGGRCSILAGERGRKSLMPRMVMRLGVAPIVCRAEQGTPEDNVAIWERNTCRSILRWCRWPGGGRGSCR